MRRFTFKNRFEIKPYIIFSYVLFVAMAIVVSLFWWSQTQEKLYLYYTVSEETSTKIKLARDMQTAVLKRIVSFHNAYINDDPFLRDHERTLFINYGGDFRKARDQLARMNLSPMESELKTKINVAVGEAGPLTEIAMDHAMSDSPPEIFLPAAYQAEMAQKILVERIDDLIEFERDLSQAKLSQSMGQLKLFRNTLLIGSFLIIIISALLAIALGRVVMVRSTKALELAKQDPLTGLRNRRGFMEALNRAIEQAHLDDTIHSLLYLDLNKFKPVNDSCGHAAGDELLSNITTTWRQLLRKTDLLSRIGGDEFTLLLHNTRTDQAENIAQKVVDATEKLGYTCKGQTFQLGVSIGITSIDRFSSSPEVILKLSDQACYAAKASDTESVVLAPQTAT